MSIHKKLSVDEALGLAEKARVEGDIDLSAELYSAALKIKTDYAHGHINFGAVFKNTGQA